MATVILQRKSRGVDEKGHNSAKETTRGPVEAAKAQAKDKKKLR
jgi:hypothetical protein